MFNEAGSSKSPLVIYRRMSNSPDECKNETIVNLVISLSLLTVIFIKVMNDIVINLADCELFIVTGW